MAGPAAGITLIAGAAMLAVAGLALLSDPNVLVLLSAVWAMVFKPGP